jgi:hypothetical protein
MKAWKGKLVGLAACLAWAALPLGAQQPPRVDLVTAHRLGTTPPMRDYALSHSHAPNALFRVFALRKPSNKPGHGGGGGGGGGTSWTDPALQSTTPLASTTSLATSFNGIGSDGYVPPDSNLSVGNGQIVETMNVDYAVYDTGGNRLQGPTAIHSIFAAASNLSSGDACASVDGGDPIVLFDKIDHRWIIGQLAYNSSFSSNHFCLAISSSADATGSYSAYDVSFGGNLPDYPKLGIWADGSWSSPGSHAGVYFSANMFRRGSRFIGAQMCGFPLSAVATAPSSITWVCTQNGTGVFSLLPADLEGSPGVAGTSAPAPAGTAEYFLQFSGTALSLYQYAVNFSNNSASVSGPYSVANVPTFHEACGGGSCVPQASTSNQLDSLGDRLMYRLSYRNYAGSPVMVVTHSVQNSSASNQTGVRWYQLTGNGSSWQAAQTGTFGPADGIYRWMGSIAQDKLGDLGVGYSISSSSLFPGLGYTGQTPTEAASHPNTLEAEHQLRVGAGSQTSTNRWGDYSAISVDPSNDCTFWYVNEYLAYTGSYSNWGTHIVGFSFPGCH